MDIFSSVYRLFRIPSDKLSPLPSDGDFRVTNSGRWRTDVRELCALLACSRSEYSKPVANASRPLTPLSMNLCDSFGVEELVTAPVSNAPLDHSHFHPTCKLRISFEYRLPPLRTSASSNFSRNIRSTILKNRRDYHFILHEGTKGKGNK